MAARSHEPFRALIPPVEAGVVRPTWSVMIPTFNCAGYLGEALESVLAQDPGEGAMQIEVVDDASTRDNPEEVVRWVGGGRVGFYRQPANVGHVRNFNTCLMRSRGHLVHLLHGDDAVRPGFYARLGEALAARPDVGMAFCRNIFTDESGTWTAFSQLRRDGPGVLDDWLPRIAVGHLVQPPSMVVRRSVYEALGGFDRRIRAYGEDWEMATRIAAHHPVWFEPEPLAVYRVRPQSLSAAGFRTGGNMDDMLRVVQINEEHFHASVARGISRDARRNVAKGTLRRARRMMEAGDRGTAILQVREALRCSRSPDVVARAMVVLGAGVAPGARP